MQIKTGNQGQLIIELFSYAKSGVKLGCLMAMCPAGLSEELQGFAKNNISQENLADSGIEDESHFTILYGYPPDFDITPLEDFLADQESLSFTLGSVSRFQCPDYDVLKVEASCPEAQALHYNLKNKFNVETSFPIFHPHGTLAYVKPSSHPELDGSQAFAGKKFSVSSLLYSPPDRAGRKYLKLGK